MSAGKTNSAAPRNNSTERSKGRGRLQVKLMTQNRVLGRKRGHYGSDGEEGRNRHHRAGTYPIERTVRKWPATLRIAQRTARVAKTVNTVDVSGIAGDEGVEPV